MIPFVYILKVEEIIINCFKIHVVKTIRKSNRIINIKFRIAVTWGLQQNALKQQPRGASQALDNAQIVHQSAGHRIL